jgi:hypothetical protein
MVVAIPIALWRAKTRSRGVSNTNGAEAQPLGVWLRGDLATHSGSEKGMAAAAEILLPISAVAIGITALGLVFDLIHAGAL